MCPPSAPNCRALEPAPASPEPACPQWTIITEQFWLPCVTGRRVKCVTKPRDNAQQLFDQLWGARILLDDAGQEVKSSGFNKWALKNIRAYIRTELWKRMPGQKPMKKTCSTLCDIGFDDFSFCAPADDVVTLPMKPEAPADEDILQHLTPSVRKLLEVPREPKGSE